MPETDDQPIEKSTADQALAWFVRLGSGDATADDRRCFRDWLSADPAHRRAYDQLARIWTELNAVSDPRLAAPQPDGAGRVPLPSRRRFLAAGTALTGLAAVGGVVAVTGLPDALTSDHYTGTAELKSVVLPDGSKVELDADTALTVELTPSARRLALRRGRALFVVAKDPARPFDVACAGGTASALGTALVVHRRGDAATVAVLEGSVAVAESAGTRPAAWQARLGPGDRVRYDRGGPGPVETRSDQAETAWRRGKLIFEDQSLGEVVAELNRYRHGTIVIADAALMTLRISGIFDIRNPDGVLDAIVRTLPVRTIALTRHLILLRPA